MSFEFKPKMRVQDLPEKVVQKMNTRKNQKLFIELVTSKQVKKAREMCERGMDPHFLADNGESPLSLAALADDIDMVNMLEEDGHAILDYRSADSKTALHKAAARGRHGTVAVRSLCYFSA